MKSSLFLSILFFLNFNIALASNQPRYSTAGFFQIPETGREVISLNPYWSFYKGNMKDAQRRELNDDDWEVVSLPHGLELLPLEASGCVNYQGEAWYRKKFRLAPEMKDKKLFLHFEGIMGKSRVYINGMLLKENWGGFLPVIVDISQNAIIGQENVIAVWCDNSNDPEYPPGKAQEVLDFTYCGGIYRDCWLVAHSPVYITDPNKENQEAGGGLFVSFNQINEKNAQVNIKLHLRNENESDFNGKARFVLKDKNKKIISTQYSEIKLAAKQDDYVFKTIEVNNPKLWSPDFPNLYDLEVYIQKGNKVIDGYMKRIGIRSLEFKGKDGFWLNGKPYPNPLMGVNRHQDFAVVGNALSNSLHWRDAKKMKDLGIGVIRNAHYPQDPAFMDACDELGMFVIVNTPGWQFWNENPVFESRIYQDIKNMIRRDRNHPSVLMWEPVLNETWYPISFAKNAHEIVHAEYPYPYVHDVCDSEAIGNEFFKIHYAHPGNGDPSWEIKAFNPDITYFTREFGDNVDDWNSHNSTSRVHLSWGEIPMLIQAEHYANPDYRCTDYDLFFKTSQQHVGGCLWHAFDHQRGYHPDPFYGGLMDAFRQPKYSYQFFKSQRNNKTYESLSETGPMVYIANEMSPFSPKDVTLYSNCDKVVLTVFEGGKKFEYNRPDSIRGLPFPIINFSGAFDFMQMKAISNNGKDYDKAYLLAEGFIGNEMVASHKVFPARRPTRISIWLDHENVSPVADGSDLITIVAGITDENGNIKRLNNQCVKFSIEGEGQLVADQYTGTNPRPVIWGTAPVLVRTTTTPGKIKIKAEVSFEGDQLPLMQEFEFETISSDNKLLFVKSEKEVVMSKKEAAIADSDNELLKKELIKVKRELNNYKLKDVERQQAEFGESK